MFLNIQMLRAIAALLVFLHHLRPHYELANGRFDLLTFAGSWGFAGVDVFFVISGFVIAHTSFDKPKNIVSAKKFFKRRIFRIYLGYWPFAVLAYILYGLLKPSHIETTSILHSLTLTSPKIADNIIGNAWSLCYELYFYLIFGLLFLLSKNRIASYLEILFWLMLIRIIVIDIPGKNPLNFMLSGYLWQFLLGCMIYKYHERFSGKYFIPLSLLICSTTGFFAVKHNISLGDQRAFIFGLFSFGLITFCLQLEKNKLLVAPQWLVSLGDSSYALYLCHVPLILCFVHFGIRDFLVTSSTVITESGFLIFVISVIIFAHVWFRKIEKPLYNASLQRFTW